MAAQPTSEARARSRDTLRRTERAGNRDPRNGERKPAEHAGPAPSGEEGRDRWRRRSNHGKEPKPGTKIRKTPHPHKEMPRKESRPNRQKSRHRPEKCRHRRQKASRERATDTDRPATANTPYQPKISDRHGIH